MKKLQKNLGDFNDYPVQKEVLVEHLGNLRSTVGHSVEISAELGGLIVHLWDKQQHVRRMFARTFRNSATRENIELLESIFPSCAYVTRKRVSRR